MVNDRGISKIKVVCLCESFQKHKTAFLNARSSQSGVSGQPLKRSNSLKKTVMSALNMRWRGSRKLVRSATVQEQIFNLGISKETNLELPRDLCREAKQELYKKCRSACKKLVLFCSFLQLFHLAQSICISHAPAFCIHSTETRSILTTSHGGWASKMQKYCPPGKNNFSEITVRWNKSNPFLNPPWPGTLRIIVSRGDLVFYGH